MTKKNITTQDQSNHPLASGVLQTMSSKEVSKLTAKRHDHVVRDIRKMIKELDDPNLGHEQYQELTDVRGYTKEFLLDEELTLTLISGYNVKMRNTIIRRWKELENGDTPPPIAPPEPKALPGNCYYTLQKWQNQSMISSELVTFTVVQRVVDEQYNSAALLQRADLLKLQENVRDIAHQAASAISRALQPLQLNLLSGNGKGSPANQAMDAAMAVLNR